MSFKIIKPPSELQKFPTELKWKPEIIDYTQHHAYQSILNQVSFAQRIPVFFTFLKYFTINLGKRLINYELIPLNIRKPKTVQGYLKFLQFAANHIFRFTKSKYLPISSDNGDLVYDNNFIIEFENHKIPLDLKMFRYEGFLNVEFYWGLEKTDHRFLDHIFKIVIAGKESEYKFQSNKNGFFIINLTDDDFDMYHTYDWYNKTNWEKLDTIKIEKTSD